MGNSSAGYFLSRKHNMDVLRFFLVLPFSLWLGLAPVGQTPGDEVAKLKERIKQLEEESARLKKAIAQKGIGSLGVPYGRIVTIEGEHDPNVGIKSVHTYRVTSVNFQKLPRPVHVYPIMEWARTKGTAGKSPLKLVGFQTTAGIGTEGTAMPFHIVDAFMIIDVLDEK
jgi:hypothetical protein